MEAGSIPARISRRATAPFLTAVVCLAALLFAATELTVRRAGDEIRVVAPRMRLLEGRTLERLHNGMAVGFEFQLSLLGDSKRSVLRRTTTRFVMSYDLWEEKFSVARVTGPTRSASHLSADAAESWCVDQLALPYTDLPGQSPVSLRLEVRAEDAERRGAGNGESGLSLTDLIDVFSRTGRSTQQRWNFESNSFRPADLKAGSG